MQPNEIEVAGGKRAVEDAISAAIRPRPGKAFAVRALVRNGLIDKISVFRYNQKTEADAEGAQPQAP